VNDTCRNFKLVLKEVITQKSTLKIFLITNKYESSEDDPHKINETDKKKRIAYHSLRHIKKF